MRELSIAGWVIVLVYTVAWAITLAVLQATDSLWKQAEWSDQLGRWGDGCTVPTGILWLPTIIMLAVAIVGLVCASKDSK